MKLFIFVIFLNTFAHGARTRLPQDHPRWEILKERCSIPLDLDVNLVTEIADVKCANPSTVRDLLTVLDFWCDLARQTIAAGSDSGRVSPVVRQLSGTKNEVVRLLAAYEAHHGRHEADLIQLLVATLRFEGVDTESLVPILEANMGGLYDLSILVDAFGLDLLRRFDLTDVARTMQSLFFATERPVFDAFVREFASAVELGDNRAMHRVVPILNFPHLISMSISAQ